MADSSGRPNPWLTLGKLFGALLATGVLAAGLVLPYVGGLGLAAKHESDTFLNTSCNLDLNDKPPEPTVITASDGKTVLARLFVQDRQPVTYNQIPLFVQQALIDTEDRRFYQHHGVDMRGLIRSAFSTSNGDTQGGSTLTMQYVKQVRYYKDIGNTAAQEADISQTLSRKMEDAQCAIQLEKHESKQQILTDYLNIAFFGENSYSIKSAAYTYFGVSDLSKLTVPQAATLIGLLQAPTEYDPFSDRDAATARRNVVLQNMVTAGDLTQAQADKYAATPLQLATGNAPNVPEGCANAQTTVLNSGFFCDYVVNWLESVDGLTATQLNTGGYTIVTTLNAAIQNSTQSRLVKQIPSNAAMTAVLPVVDPKTGDVLAMASNKLYGNLTSATDTTHTMLPIFTSATAFGASTYKLFSLLTALETGVPSTLPINTYGSAGQTTHAYTPQNCGYGATKPITNANQPGIDYTTTETLATGTAKSSNTFYGALDDELFGCSLAPIVNLAESLGMTNFSAVDPDGNGKTTVGQDIVTNGSLVQLALGSGLGTSPLAITGAYAAVADGGTYNTPAPVLKVTDSTGAPGPVNRTAARKVIAPQVAAQAAQILTGDTLTGGTSASVFTAWNASTTSRVAGKTGTAVAAAPNESKNSALWFAGITPNLAATMAVINPAAPSNPIPSLPGQPHAATTAYGDYASSLWLNALEPTLQSSQYSSWTWPDPTTMAGVADMTTVPPITGDDVATATAAIKAAGFTLAPLSAQMACASSAPAGSVAFYGPQLATPGSTITYCPSTGIAPYTYVPPPTPTPTPTPTPHTSGSSSATTRSSTTPHPGNGHSSTTPVRGPVSH